MASGHSMGPGLQLVGARFLNFHLGKLSREFKLCPTILSYLCSYGPLIGIMKLSRAYQIAPFPMTFIDLQASRLFAFCKSFQQFFFVQLCNS